MMKYTISLFTAFSLCLSTIAVSAAESNALSPEMQKIYDAIVQEAVTSYAAKQYADAVVSFKKALEIQTEPELVYNIARSYERMARADDALEWYQKFLDMPGTTGELRTRALNNIAALRDEIAARDAAQSSESAQPIFAGDDTVSSQTSDNPEDASAGESTSDNTSQNTLTVSPDLLRREEKRPLRIAGWVLVGVGAAAMATGGVFGILAVKNKGDYDDAGSSPDKLDYRDNFKRDAILFDVVFFSGTAIASLGVSFLIVHAIKNRSQTDSLSGEISNIHRSTTRTAFTVTPGFVFGDGIIAGGLTGQF